MTQRAGPDPLVVLSDEKAKRVLEYLASNLTGSFMKLSYELKMGPKELEETLAKLEAAGLIHKTESVGFQENTYYATEQALAMQRFLLAQSPRQNRQRMMW